MDPLRLDLLLEPERLPTAALPLLRRLRPSWTDPRIVFKVFTDGITNKLIGCWCESDPKDIVLVRVYGENTSLLIDRKAETENFQVLHKAGYAPQFYAVFGNGIAYEYVPGEVLTTQTVKNPNIYPLVAKMMANFHCVDHESSQLQKPVLWSKIRHYLSLIPSKYTSDELNEKYNKHFPGGMKDLEKEMIFLEKHLSIVESKVVFCHNDLLLANIIHNKGKVTFIDYEYSACNYQAYDIGNHFAEFAGVSDVDYSLYPDKKFQISWLKIYLEQIKNCQKNFEPIKQSEIETLYIEVNKFALVSHLLWAAWALVQAHHSTIDFDFMGYASLRIKEYLKKKNVFLSL